MATSRKKSVKQAAGKAGTAVKKAATRVASALKPKKALNRGSKASKKAARPAGAASASRTRTVQRKSDVAPQELETLTPRQQSSRGPFDKHRGERLRDKEALSGVTNANERWSEEDELTNRTGDPRIGTRGRKTY